MGILFSRSSLTAIRGTQFDYPRNSLLNTIRLVLKGVVLTDE